MSAKLTVHGKIESAARLIPRTGTDQPPFISLDIEVEGITVTLIDVTQAGLDALAAAITVARDLLPAASQS